MIADGFYEWRRPAAGERGPKQPFLIRRIDGAPMGLAGLYETCVDPNGGELDTACIVTTAANALMAPIHDRMPAMIPPELFSRWLDADGVAPAEAQAMLRPAPEDALELVPVSTRVNKVSDGDEGLQTPVGPPLRAPG